MSHNADEILVVYGGGYVAAVPGIAITTRVVILIQRAAGLDARYFNGDDGMILVGARDRNRDGRRARVGV